MICHRCECENENDATTCVGCGVTIPATDEPTPMPGDWYDESPEPLGDDATVVQVEVRRADADGDGEEWPVRTDDYYVDLRVIGEGGMGTVTLVRDIRNEREVCRKRPRSLSPAVRGRFRREIKVLAQGWCGDIVPCLDYGRDPDGPFLVMPYYRRGSLQQRVSERGPLDASEMFDLAKAMARALDHLHRNGILHRDIKPANILLTDNDQAHLADFGLAGSGAAGSTRARGVGTAGYAAPELQAGGEATPRSDLFALGLTLRFALTAAPPGSGREDELAEPWRSLIARLTERSPERRIQSAAELLAAVDRIRVTPQPEVPERCPKCSVLTDQVALHCGSCGESLVEDCGVCRTVVRRGSRCCDRCGQHLAHYRQAVGIFDEAMELMQAARFGDVQKALERIAELAPKATDLIKRLQNRTRSLGPRVQKLRKKARAKDLREGPRAGLELWKELLALCPRDEEALENWRQLRERERKHDFFVQTKTVEVALESDDPDAADRCLRELAALAQSEEEHACVARMRVELDELRTEIARSYEDQVRGWLRTGNLSRARDALEAAREGGLPDAEVAVLELAIRRTRRWVRLRDSAIAVIVLLVAAGGLLWYFNDRDLTAKSAGLEAFEAGDYAAARLAWGRIIWPDEDVTGMIEVLAALGEEDPAGVAIERLLAAEASLAGVGQFGARAHHQFEELVERRLCEMLGLANPGDRIRVGSRGFEVATNGFRFEMAGVQLVAEDGRYRLPDTVSDTMPGDTVPMRCTFTHGDREHATEVAVVVKCTPPQIVGLAKQVRVEAGKPCVLRFRIDDADPGADSVRPIARLESETGGPLAVERDGDDWRFEVDSSTGTDLVARVDYTDSFGNQAEQRSVEITFERPARPPIELELASTTPALTNATLLPLKVKSNADRVQAVLAGDSEPIPFEKAGELFEGNVTLQSGTNKISVRAARDGDAGERVLVIEVDLDTRQAEYIAPADIVDAGSELRITFDEKIKRLDSLGGGPVRLEDDRVAVVEASAVPGPMQLAFDAYDLADNPTQVRHSIDVVRRRQHGYIHAPGDDWIAAAIHERSVAVASRRGIRVLPFPSEDAVDRALPEPIRLPAGDVRFVSAMDAPRFVVGTRLGRLVLCEWSEGTPRVIGLARTHGPGEDPRECAAVAGERVILLSRTNAQDPWLMRSYADDLQTLVREEPSTLPAVAALEVRRASTFLGLVATPTGSIQVTRRPLTGVWQELEGAPSDVTAIALDAELRAMVGTRTGRVARWNGRAFEDTGIACGAAVRSIAIRDDGFVVGLDDGSVVIVSGEESPRVTTIEIGKDQVLAVGLVADAETRAVVAVTKWHVFEVEW
ncbi:MAG: protein kinase [Planctomycetes bacterium]|nr:protein kinase [Planctomycetota bacterium]